MESDIQTAFDQVFGGEHSNEGWLVQSYASLLQSKVGVGSESSRGNRKHDATSVKHNSEASRKSELLRRYSQQEHVDKVSTRGSQSKILQTR